MTRKEFEDQVFALTEQLIELVNKLPEISVLEDSTDIDEFEQSKIAFELSILAIEQDLKLISDKYFDEVESL